MRRWLLPLLALVLVAASPEGERALADGDAAWADGDVTTALTRWSTALGDARDTGDDPAYVEAALRLATAHRELGRVATAATVLDQAEARTKDAVATARITMSRGQIAVARGELGEGERLLKKAFEAFRAADDPGGAANAAVALGLARLALGRTTDATKALTAALTLFEKLGDARGRADATTDLGLVALRAGDLRGARERLEAAVSLYEGAGDPVGAADATTGLARVAVALGDDATAARLYGEALSVARSRKDVPRQATLLLDLAVLDLRAGDPATASSRYKAAEEALIGWGRPAEAVGVALHRAVLSGERPAYEAVVERARELGTEEVEAAALLDLGVLLRASDPKTAREHAKAASDLADRLELPAIRWRARTLLGQLLLDAGKASAAVEPLSQAVDELERTRRDLDDADATRFTLDHRAPYEALLDALLATGDTVGALVVGERLQRSDLPRPTGDGRYGEIVAEQAFAEQELAAAVDAGQDAERVQALRERLAALRVEFAREVDTLRATHPDFDATVRVDPEDLEAIQGELDPGVVVLQPVLLADRLVLLVFTHDSLAARTVEVDPALVAGTVSKLARSLRVGLVSRAEWTTAQADQLGAWLLDPIAAELEGRHTLVVSPSGPFRQLPFGMLRRGGRWLVQDMAVASVTHVGSIRGRPAADGLRVRGESLLLLGDPDGTLPEAQTEVKEIAARFPGARLLVGADGTSDALRTAAPGRTAVHLATHGRIDPQHPDRSYLVMGGDDGRLAYGEIPGLGPYLGDCRLVVLSACESGLPVDAAEGDGDEVIVSINGLSAQFRRAGVETLVASLWKVDDAATRALMVRFYDELSGGTDAAEALRRAQVAVLEAPEHARPWYWGAFVVMGDWR